MKKNLTILLIIFSFIFITPKAKALANWINKINEETMQCATAIEFTESIALTMKYPQGWKTFKRPENGTEFEAYCRAYGYENIGEIKAKIAGPSLFLIIVTLLFLLPIILVIKLIFKKTITPKKLKTKL